MAKKKKKIDLYDVDHPFRRAAIDIIKNLIEPLLQKGIDGRKYYNLENDITNSINKRIGKLVKNPIKPDNSSNQAEDYTCSNCGYVGNMQEEAEEDDEYDLFN